MIQFYRGVFDAREILCLAQPDGRVAPAELNISGSAIMLADEFPARDFSPEPLGGAAVSILVYVPNADEAVRRAGAVGARLHRAV